MIVSIDVPPSNGAIATTFTFDTTEKIKAIKALRLITNLGLREAKDAIDEFLHRHDEVALKNLIERHRVDPNREIERLRSDNARLVGENHRLQGQIATMSVLNGGANYVILAGDPRTGFSAYVTDDVIGIDPHVFGVGVQIWHLPIEDWPG